jgi:copper chaperone CopZ
VTSSRQSSKPAIVRAPAQTVRASLPDPCSNMLSSQTSTISKAKFSVKGMFCAACVGTIEEAIKMLPGVESASAQLLMETADVKYDASKTTGTVTELLGLSSRRCFCVASRGHRRCNLWNRYSCFLPSVCCS